MFVDSLSKDIIETVSIDFKFSGAVGVGKSTIVKILSGKNNFNSKDYEMVRRNKLFSFIATTMLQKEIELKAKMNFKGKYLFYPTQGVELHDKALEVCGHIVDTVLVDTAGHELYKWMIKPICDENALYALCFDLTNKDSLDILKEYLEELRIQKSVLIGCKLDLQSRHSISLSAAEEFAINNNLKLHLTSTVTFHNKFLIILPCSMFTCGFNLSSHSCRCLSHYSFVINQFDVLRLLKLLQALQYSSASLASN
uniref:GTP-binding protein n=1 Tax=Elaeophora elaphi TaxID=1147741 RepID=A0A0R3S7F2_9BILA